VNALGPRSTEDFSYFTLRRAATQTAPATSLFGIACTRQLDANELINRPPDVTRSTVQKAVVTILDSPKDFGRVREKLSFITKAWFNQKDFTDLAILRDFQESLVNMLKDQEEERDQFFGIASSTSRLIGCSYDANNKFPSRSLAPRNHTRIQIPDAYLVQVPVTPT
jgi:Transport protein Avl9